MLGHHFVLYFIRLTKVFINFLEPNYCIIRCFTMHFNVCSCHCVCARCLEHFDWDVCFLLCFTVVWWRCGVCRQRTDLTLAWFLQGFVSFGSFTAMHMLLQTYVFYNQNMWYVDALSNTISWKIDVLQRTCLQNRCDISCRRRCDISCLGIMLWGV
jgi:hypothetical protein